MNSYATPTPAVEAEYVYLHFGRYGTTCLNSTTGETVWERNDLQCEHIQGPGSSLFIYKDKLIVHLEGTDVQHILALDKRSGDIGETHIRWRMKAPILMRTSEYLYKIVGD